METSLKHGKGLAIDYDWKCLNERCDGDEGDGRLGNHGMVKEPGDQTGRQEREIDREEDSKIRGRGCQGGADAGEWALTGIGWIVEQGRSDGGEVGARSGYARFEAGIAEDLESVVDEGLASEGGEGFVVPHTAGSAAGENKSAGGRW
jgi:hypothetical protein